MPIIKHLSEYKRRTRLLLFIALGWTLLLTVLSLFSVKKLPKLEFDFSDKLLHSFFYLILSLLWFLYFEIKDGKKKLHPLLIGSIIFFYGIVIEALQEIMPYGRSADWKDMVANAMGILIAVLLFNFILDKLKALKE